ncbi:hypothetical protein CLHUN_35920 [Ruminiclostridium hungatei]|uniref:DUF2933 domain-containing protein n=1 Tax=Ruminiclostridium hungatei TaxID=48256 RepID=A0A1V4SGR8_RUMHU|nr:hypothetical protein [Ruminiclostridium hungatei]OPX42467.1 hypothetical protein CLHUN_35920 [Ruminiclostridium hungatei]
MNCHGNHNNNQNKKHKGHMSHMLIMALCCGAPLILLLVVSFLINNGGAAIARPLAAIAPFICPVMMVFMIPMMLKGHKNNNAQKTVCQADARTEENTLTE